MAKLTASMFPQLQVGKIENEWCTRDPAKVCITTHTCTLRNYDKVSPNCSLNPVIVSMLDSNRRNFTTFFFFIFFAVDLLRMFSSFCAWCTMLLCLSFQSNKSTKITLGAGMAEWKPGKLPVEAVPADVGKDYVCIVDSHVPPSDRYNYRLSLYYMVVCITTNEDACAYYNILHYVQNNNYNYYNYIYWPVITAVVTWYELCVIPQIRMLVLWSQEVHFILLMMRAKLLTLTVWERERASDLWLWGHVPTCEILTTFKTSLDPWMWKLPMVTKQVRPLATSPTIQVNPGQLAPCTPPSIPT